MYIYIKDDYEASKGEINGGDVSQVEVNESEYVHRGEDGRDKGSIAPRSGLDQG